MRPQSLSGSLKSYQESRGAVQRSIIPIKAALADRKKVVRGGFFLVLPFLVFEKSVVVAAMAACAEAVQRQG